MPSRRHSAGTTARPHAAGSSASWLPWRLAPQATGSILDRGAVPVAAVVLVVGGLVPADRGVPRPLRTGPREAQQIGAHGTLFLVIDGRYTVPGAICTDDPPSPRPESARSARPARPTETLVTPGMWTISGGYFACRVVPSGVRRSSWDPRLRSYHASPALAGGRRIGCGADRQERSGLEL